MLNIPTSAPALAAALEGLVRLNEWFLSRRPFPSVLDAGIKFRRERRATRRSAEHWQNIDELFRNGEGDCEDIVAARVAELRHVGLWAEACVIRTGAKRFHALVCFEDGSTEDPARELGM